MKVNIISVLHVRNPELQKLCHVSKVIWLVSDTVESQPDLHIHNPCPFLLTFLITALRSSELWFSHQRK